MISVVEEGGVGYSKHSILLDSADVCLREREVEGR